MKEYNLGRKFNVSCFFHQNKENVAQCPQCGKYLCRECGSLTKGGLCYACSKQIHDNAKKELIFTITASIFAIICFIVGIILITSNGTDSNTYWVGFALFAVGGFVPAWRLLGKIADRLFGDRYYAGLVLVAVLAFKFAFSMILGCFMFIIYTIKSVIGIINYVRISKDMKIINNNFVNIV